MGVTRLVIVAALFFFTGGVRAEGCLAAEELRVIAEHFTQFSEMVNGREHCYDATENSRLLKGLAFMRQTRFAEQMQRSVDELFGGAFRNDWYSYFTQRITEFRVDPTCEPGVLAYVRFWGSTMFVCPLALTDALSALDRATVFMHEARHIDGYPHVTCARGARAGMRGACDSRIADQGSYAVTVETYAQIARYAVDLHPALRAYARAMAITYSAEAFNVPVRVTSTPRFLAVTTDRRFHALDVAAARSSELGSLPTPGRLSLRSQHLILIPDDKTLGARYVFTHDEGEVAQMVGDLMSAYDAASPAKRAEFIDVHSGGQWFAQAYRDRIRFNCGYGPVAPVEVRLSETPIGFVYPDGYDREASTARLMLSSGRALEVGCADSREAFVRPTDLKFDRAYSRMHRVGEDRLALDPGGTLYRVDAAGNGSPLTTDLRLPVLDLVPTEYVQFFDAVP